MCARGSWEEKCPMTFGGWGGIDWLPSMVSFSRSDRLIPPLALCHIGCWFYGGPLSYFKHHAAWTPVFTSWGFPKRAMCKTRDQPRLAQKVTNLQQKMQRNTVKWGEEGTGRKKSTQTDELPSELCQKAYAFIRKAVRKRSLLFKTTFLGSFEGLSSMASTFRGVNSFPLVLVPRTRSKRPSFWLQNKQK